MGKGNGKGLIQSEMSVVWGGERYESAANRASRPAIEATLKKAKALAQERAPVRTGEYREGIDIIPAKRTARGWEGGLTGKAKHSIFIELGTSKMAARHILGNAMRDAAPSLHTRVIAEFRRHAPKGSPAPPKGGGWQNW